MNEYTKIIYLMGTKISLYVKGDVTEKLLEKACSMLIHYEEVFSANSDNSQLAMLKKTASLAPQKVDEELYELIKIGIKHSLCENTYLNIAIGPLIKLWRIGFKEVHVPEKETIIKVLELLNPENIELDDEKKTVYFLKKGIEIDLGAIAKGYFADKVMEFFKENGAVSAMVDMGGNVLVFGESPSNSGDWNVGIQNPFLPRGNAVALVKIKDQSVVTSGIYERVFEKDGSKYHHIFDSKTGYPIESNIASLTIIANKSLDCDIYTTKLFGLDATSIIHRVNRINGMGAVVITVDGKLAYTDNLIGRISPLTM
ncbi:FAD:protein FMN transferase [Clostridium saccharobutylicum]|uniref:FAD:protein FMN transferase n=1 Tax=Clostridium saccharobutylicum DSM 13864 TaxID=1345695 RepID=U5MQI3_CLOSA|nr:FAD:protein FMN transferase [Clostridium saccharobutylicum]AGX41906.1 thiamine biosynthesis lipoprotein ApbE [Clostridium saccharobutylicum DSM 13864]AQR89184.1 thiamine biosynthesis lipoprotein ApbE precursor [Clostridium saccharobutylicum]AQR99085.1 thiamine biosynthesis lipoprotein ApbE precursor [Clostridium saccharobutylicum]AQS08807.1 thiamine biosynthesis lipoprotein ApbE precursor [Clostridium saccharobutylicum]AQS13073.1 thiamine biosynthesis lipoprotein ApbE precursor [Clostridium